MSMSTHVVTWATVVVVCTAAVNRCCARNCIAADRIRSVRLCEEHRVVYRTNIIKAFELNKWTQASCAINKLQIISYKTVFLSQQNGAASLTLVIW